MQEVRLLSTRIFIWPGVHAESGENIRVLEPDARKAFVLTDRNCVDTARRVVMGLQQAGIEVAGCAVPPGETEKSLATASRLFDRLVGAKMDRKSALVAVGGGVITDLGGFVASTFMRGIPLFLVPTTLLAQLDAAVGGKTAVNLQQGKNLVGTFYQPAAVFSDPIVLQTLPKREYIGGLAEVVKYGMVQDAKLLEFVEANINAIKERQPGILEDLVFRCTTIKAGIVEKDEKESSLRAILNYGHTVGHGLEAAGEYKKIHHGEAIAVGMECEALMAKEMGIADADTLAVQNRLLKLCGLPTRIKGLPKNRVLQAMELDKKTLDGQARFALPEGVGKVRFPVEVPADLIQQALTTITV